ncbi:MAG TPA: hypothetical protein VFS99_05240 [Xanthomonadaceae bacterium]|nr:hypothetical protein [Xanthomonadaceae bacterium]
MSDFNGYAVFFFPNAIEALGEAIKPYLQDSPGGPHILCRDIDVGGALAQLTLEGRTTDGRELDLELMFPTNMVRMIVSARSDPAFGFGPRTAVEPAHQQAPVIDDEAPGPAHPPEAAPRTVPGRAAKAAKAARDAKAAKKARPAKKSPAKKSPAKKSPRKAAKKASKKRR